MPDVLQKIISANPFVNGSVVVSTNMFGAITNHEIPPTINQITQIQTQSGVLDNRFDDPRYYSGDTSA